MARPRIHDEDTRDRMLDVAGTVLRREGPAAMTVRRIAEEAGASTTALYRLFGSKNDVVQAMFRAGFANLERHQAAVEADDPIERIRHHAWAYRAAARSRPHLYEVMFACPFPEFVPDEADQARSVGTLLRLREAVEDAIAAGVLVGDAGTLTMGLWGLVHGLAMLELAGSLDQWADADDVWVTMVDACLRGATPVDRPAG